MAAIREEYILADRFSAGFTRLLGFLGRTSTASGAAAAGQERLAQASGGTGTAMTHLAGAALQMADAAMDAAYGMGSASEQAEALAGKTVRVSAAQDKANASMRQGASAADGLARKLLSAAAAYVSLRTAQQFIGMTDTYTQTTARLDRMNDGLQTTAELQDLIYQAAQRSRGAYQETADLVAKLGTMAPEAFDSSQELVAFAEQINKQFVLAGASTQGAEAAMLQLTQALSSGVLRGDELNSVLEQAPTITQTIAKYLDVNIGQLREMASEGAITADVVKAAMFSAAEETNAAFESIPLTFSQAWTMAGNAASRALGPAMQRLTDLLNSDLGRSAVNGLIAGFELLGNAAAGAIDLLAAGAQLVADHWDTVSLMLQFAGGVFLALAAVSVASALASAGAWAIAHLPLLLLIAVAGAAIMAMHAMGMTSEEIFAKIGAGAGWLYTLGYNFVASAWDLIATFAEFFANVFNDPVAAIANLFLGLFNFIMDVVGNAAGAIDALLGSDISGAVKSFQNGVNAFVTGIFGENKVKIERMEQIGYADTMGQWAAAAGGLGRALDDLSIDDILGSYGQESFDYAALAAGSGIAGTLDDISADTSAIKRSVALSEEDMKLLVDMAERQYVNNIALTAQTPVITINGQNTGDTEADLKRLEEALQRILIEQAASHTSMSYR